MVPQKKHYMRLCPGVSCALNVQGTLFLRFYCIFPCVSLSPLPLHLHSSTLHGGYRSRLHGSLSPCWVETWYREVSGEQKFNQLREVTAVAPSALKWLALAVASSSLTPKQGLMNRFIIKHSSLQSRKKHEPYSGFIFTETLHRSRASLFLPSHHSHSFLRDLFPSKQKH